jgi:hypothetical protein
MITVADILSGSIDRYLVNHKLYSKQRKVVNKIINCFSDKSRSILFSCTNQKCDYYEYKNKPCRDRHCNRCNGRKKLKWLIKISHNLIPLPYYHVVFTLPSELHNLAICNQKIVYDIFFKSSFYVLNKFSNDDRFFGGKLGFIGLLHTWGQRLNYHPHIHYMVLSGGIKEGKFKKLPYQRKFIFPVKALSKVMMGKFIESLKYNYYKGNLMFPGKLEVIANEQAFNNFLYLLSKKSWVVYSKAPIPNTDRTLEYISRYTHKVAISNYRIKSYNNNKVCFEYIDYRQKDNLGIPKKKLITFSDIEFIRRFLLHILPDGFRKIRYGGIFSSNQKAEAVKIINKTISAEIKKVIDKVEQFIHELEKRVLFICPKCESRVTINEYG